MTHTKSTIIIFIEIIFLIGKFFGVRHYQELGPSFFFILFFEKFEYYLFFLVMIE